MKTIGNHASIFGGIFSNKKPPEPVKPAVQPPPENKGYFDIHCPYCGGIISPIDVMFSINEFVQEIFNQRLDEKFNDGILGVIDEEEINLILDNDYLWDMSVKDINSCYVGNMFVLAGENLIKRFGPNAIKIYGNITEAELDAIDQSTNVNDAIAANEKVRSLVEEILNNVSQERLLRTEVETEDRDVAVFNLIKYAKSGKVLFKIHLKIQDDKDNNGNIIFKDIRSEDERIICKSKRCCICGNELSKMSGKYEEKIISFIGSPASGKSAYLAAAVDKLITHGRSEYGIEVILDYQSSDYISFNESCLYPYSKGFAITKTNQDTFPQLSIALKNLNTGKTYLYTFVDIPGETFIDENGCNVGDLLANRRIIKHASVIWFCVSAKQLFTSKVGRTRKKRDGTIENEEMKDLGILGSNTIEFANEMFAESDKRPAVAVILTKSDLLTNFVLETTFDGDESRNRALKREYFKTICPASTSGYGEDEDVFDYCDGEPTTLDYVYGGKFKYQRFINQSRSVAEFIKSYGENPYAEKFLGDVTEAFQKNQNTLCPCFSEASYGREPVERYSLDVAVRFLLAKKDSIKQRDYEDLIDIFGEDVLSAFEKGEGRLPVIKEKDDISYVQTLYKKYNPVNPFGIMSILEWSFAYTGFIECVESSDGETWNTLPTWGPVFDVLQSRLTLETPNEIIMTKYR